MHFVEFNMNNIEYFKNTYKGVYCGVFEKHETSHHIHFFENHETPHFILFFEKTQSNLTSPPVLLMIINTIILRLCRVIFKSDEIFWYILKVKVYTEINIKVMNVTFLNNYKNYNHCQ